MVDAVLHFTPQGLFCAPSAAGVKVQLLEGGVNVDSRVQFLPANLVGQLKSTFLPGTGARVRNGISDRAIQVQALR